MYTKLITNIIQEKLKNKERALSHKTRYFGESKDGALKLKDIQSRTTFVRMCSNKLNVPNIVISGGELDFEGDMKFGLPLSQEFYGGSYTDEQDQIGNKYGARPISGIKNIEVAYKGSWKAIREATVTWVVGGIPDLERLTPYFLTVGKTVALDWGWVNPNVTTYAEMFNGQTPFIYFEDGEFQVDQNIFNNPQFKIQKSGGDYDALAGKVSNFETTLRSDGGFDCTTKITSIGSALFQKPIDKPANQIQYDTIKAIYNDKQKKDQSEKEMKETAKIVHDSDNIINAIVNLKGIILTSEFGRKVKDLPTAYEKLRTTQIKGLRGHIHFGPNYGFAVDSLNNPNILWMNKNSDMKARDDRIGEWIGFTTNNEEIFVKWGWFEDQLLNRYVSVKGGKDNEIKMTIRSIDTVLGSDNLPIELTDIIAKEKSRRMEVREKETLEKKRAINMYYGGLMYTIVANDTLTKIANKYKISVSEILELNDIENPSLISTGQEIMLPSSAVIPAEDLPEDYFQNLEQSMQSTSYNPSNPSLNDQYKSSQNNTTEYETNQELESFDSYEYEVDEFQDEKTSFRGLYDLKNRGNYLKTPTLIKNSKALLKPKDPFKFFSTELFPSVSDFTGTLVGALDLEKDTKSFITALKSLENNEFTMPENEGMGRLRYMWVNIKEIQTAFGINFKEKSDSKPVNINPPGTLEKGIKNLLTQLNRNFYDFWDFELTVDPYDSTNIKVIDKKAVDISGDSIAYTKWKTNSHKVSKPGIYKFPSFKVGSIVKNQSLSFKIPDSMAITIMYGSNIEEKENRTSSEHNNPQINKMFITDKSIEYEDKYLTGIKSSNISNNSSLSFVNVGSENVNHNSKIVENEGIKIHPKSWWRKWTGGDKVEPSSDNYAKPRTKFEIINDNIVFMKEEKDMDVYRSKGLNVRKENAAYVQERHTPSLYEINDSGFSIKPGVEKVLRSRLNGGVIIGKEDSIKVDTVIPAELTLEIDGTGGLVPGDICQTEYIQPKYNANFYKDKIEYGPYVYFQIVGISQKVDSAGWFTELTTKMRINHIPDVQDLQIEDAKVERIDEDPLPYVPRPSIPVPPDEEDIADDVTLDDLDFDDFENWSVPLDEPGKTEIPTKSRTFGVGTLEEWQKSENDRINIGNYTHSFPKISEGMITLSSTTMKGSTRSNLQLGPQGFKLNKEAYEKGPVRHFNPVPTDDEDIADDVIIDDIPFDSFTEWLVPALGPIKRKTTDEKREKVVKQEPKKKKTGQYKGKKRMSTFPGFFAHNGNFFDKYLYASRHQAKWRPSYRYPDGSISWKSQKTISGKTYDFFDSSESTSEDVYGPQLPDEVIEIKAMRSMDELKRYWDGHIEEPNTTGRSRLRDDGSSSTVESFQPGLVIGGQE